jgi:hypothetical protein
MTELTVWLIGRVRHARRVAVVVFFLAAFVTFTTRARSDWLAVAIGTVMGLFFGLLFAFADELADVLENGSRLTVVETERRDH